MVLKKFSRWLTKKRLLLIIVLIAMLFVAIVLGMTLEYVLGCIAIGIITYIIPEFRKSR